MAYAARLSRAGVLSRPATFPVASLMTLSSALVRWLIATHHGYARPFWPCAEHGIGHAELMDVLQVKHGSSAIEPQMRLWNATR
jgi:hypothetical protein